MHTSKDVTSATVTWDVVHTLLCLMGISYWSSFYQYTTECMFCFKSVPDIETVPSVPKFVGKPINLKDNNHTLIYQYVEKGG
jgi:hypothetical protein